MKPPELGHTGRISIPGEQAKQLAYKVTHTCPKARAVVEVDLNVNPRCPHCGVIFQVEAAK